MPQPHRLRVTISLDKLPKRQQNFLLSFSGLNQFDAEKFYAHLINYFYLNPQSDSIKNIVGFLGEIKSKQTINFYDELLVKLLTKYKKKDREIYCLAALYEMSNYLAYQLYQYHEANKAKKDLLKIAQLENEFFKLGVGSYLDIFINMMKENDFLNNAFIMSASFNSENIKTALLLDHYTENLGNEEFNETILITNKDQTNLDLNNQVNTDDTELSNSWNHIQIA